MSEAPARPPRLPVTQLLLVRCGELEDGSFMPDFTGHADPPLSKLGRAQAESIARRLGRNGGPPILAGYASPLAAARTTAQIIEAMLGLPEIETSTALATIMPEELPAGKAGLDALSLIADNVWRAVEVLREMHPPDVSILLVSHELPIRALICRALAVPLEDSHRLTVNEGSLSVIEFRGPRTLLAALNDVCHVDEIEAARP